MSSTTVLSVPPSSVVTSNDANSFSAAKTGALLKTDGSPDSKSARKPDRKTAMLELIKQVKAEFPLYEPSTFICGANTDCQGCPKKLLELVDSEINYWEHAIARGVIPSFDQLRRFGKMCLGVKRGLARNNLLYSQRVVKSQLPQP